MITEASSLDDSVGLTGRRSRVPGKSASTPTVFEAVLVRKSPSGSPLPHCLSTAGAAHHHERSLVVFRFPPLPTLRRASARLAYLHLVDSRKT